MGVLKQFPKVKLFCGMIFADRAMRDKAGERLAEQWSALEQESAAMPFDYTDYYCEEMGAPLFRGFTAFRDLADPQVLPDFKRMTVGLEKEFSHQGRRRINLDPGYVSTASVVIATAKNHYHRIPLREGVYAHLEYVVRVGKLHPLEWTYPDFRTAAYMDYFNCLRLCLREQLRREPPGESD